MKTNRVKIISSCILNFALKLRFVIVLCLFCSTYFSNVLVAQTSTKEKVYQGVILDEVMVKSVQSGFNVNAFVDKVKKDTTFYKAFKTLRLMSYTMYNDISMYNKKGDVKASYNSISRQDYKNGCRTMTVKQEKSTGDFYTKKKDYNYYTAKLYAHLFFTKGKICDDNNIIGERKEYKGTTKYEEQLRILIFNPGQRISGIPGIGDNVAIFEEPYFSKYDFRLSRETHLGDECYLFKAIPKQNYKNDVVINELKTWIRVSDQAIVARDYSLSYKMFVYDFDVKMHVKLKTVKNQLVPYEINYTGNWHAITQPRENGTFVAIFTDFE